MTLNKTISCYDYTYIHYTCKEPLSPVNDDCLKKTYKTSMNNITQNVWRKSNSSCGEREFHQRSIRILCEFFECLTRLILKNIICSIGNLHIIYNSVVTMCYKIERIYFNLHYFIKKNILYTWNFILNILIILLW